MSMQERERTERERMEKAPTPEVGEPEVTMRRTYSTQVEGPVTWEEMRALLQREPVGMLLRTWRPTTGGLLAIIAGGWNLFIGLGMVFEATFVTDLLGNVIAGTAVSLGIGYSLIALGAIAIIGGAMAIARRAWGIALIGSIAALVPSPAIIPTLLGVLSLIFVTLGRPEFRMRTTPAR